MNYLNKAYLYEANIISRRSLLKPCSIEFKYMKKQLIIKIKKKIRASQVWIKTK